MKWLQTTIGQVCEPTGQRDPSGIGDETFRYVDIAGIDREAKTISRVDPISCSDAPSRARKVIRRGDVLVSTVRPNLNAVAQVPDELDDTIASTGFAVLRARPELVDSRYLFYRVQHQEFVQFLTSRATGASYPAVTDGVVRSAPLPLPPISEQHRVVELLDEADRLRKLRRQADVKTIRVLPALFLKMFGDPATNPKQFPTRALGDRDVCVLNPRLDTDLSEDAEVSFVPMADVEETLGRIVGSQKRCYHEVRRGFTPFRDGDVLFAKITPCMQNGKAAIAERLMNGVGFGSTEFHVLRAAEAITPEWLFSLVRLQSFRNHAVSAFTGSAGQQRVPAEFLKQYRVPVPPKAEVIHFSETFKAIVSRQIEMSAVTGHINSLFHVLLHRAFAGDLTATWRVGHMQTLLNEVSEQAKLLNLPPPTVERLATQA